ncbi:MAG: sugar phosphate isomerase/epimerase family protein [Caldilineaceae bacterium]
MTQFSCLPVSLYADFTSGRRTLNDWFQLAAALGLDGADVSVAHLASCEAAYLDGLAAQAKAAGVQIAMLVTYSDFTHPDAAERAQQVQEVNGFIAAAARLGAAFVRVTAGQAHPGVQLAEGAEWAVAGLTACLDTARQHGVTLVYENHTKGSVWTYNDFSQPSPIFLDIVKRTAQTDLKLLFDTANTLATGDDPLRVLQQVIHRVAVIHVNDIRRAGHFEPVAAGDGAAPIPQIFDMLAAHGFDGWISIEEASKQDEAGFRRAIPYVQAAWRQAGSQNRGSKE